MLVRFFGNGKGGYMHRLFEEAGFDIAGRVLSKEDFRPYRYLGMPEKPTLNPDRMRYFVEQAEAALEKPLPVIPISYYMDFQLNGNRSRFQDVVFDRRDQMVHLALAEVFERKGRFISKLVDVIFATLEESTWLLPAHDRHNPYHSQRVPATFGDRPHGLAIFSATCGAQLTFIYHYLKEELDAVSPVIRERIAYEVHRRIITPFATAQLGFVGSREHAPNNWCPWVVCEALYCMAFISEDMAERELVVRRAMEFSDNFVGGYGDDGGCDEGPGYWGGAGGAYFVVLEELYDLTAGYLDLFDHPLVRAIGEYEAKVYIGKDYFLNYADCGLRLRTGGATLRVYGDRVGSDIMMGLGCSLERMNLTTRQGLTKPYGQIRNLMLPLPPSEGVLPSAERVWFSDLKIMLKRESSDAERGLCVALKGGHNSESHNHNDIGQFYLYRDAEPVLVDLGSMTYTRKTFSPQRYELLCMRSLYHNTPDVDGCEQLPGREYCSTDEVYGEDGSIAMNIERAYPADAGMLSYRRYVNLENGVAILRDTCVLDGERELDIHFNMMAEPELTKAGEVRLPHGVVMRYPTDFVASVQRVEFGDAGMTSNWGQDHFFMLHLKKKTAGGTFEIRFEKA